VDEKALAKERWEAILGTFFIFWLWDKKEYKKEHICHNTRGKLRIERSEREGRETFIIE